MSASNDPTQRVRLQLAQLTDRNRANSAQILCSLCSLTTSTSRVPEEFSLTQRHQGAKRTAFRPTDPVLCALGPLREIFLSSGTNKTRDFFVFFAPFGHANRFVKRTRGDLPRNTLIHRLVLRHSSFPKLPCTTHFSHLPNSNIVGSPAGPTCSEYRVLSISAGTIGSGVPSVR